MDALSGDGDLGFTMSKGFAVANECAKEAQDKDIGTLLFMAGRGKAAPRPPPMGAAVVRGPVSFSHPTPPPRGPL